MPANSAPTFNLLPGTALFDFGYPYLESTYKFFIPGKYDEARAMVIQPDGKALLFGSTKYDEIINGHNYGSLSFYAIARFNLDGSLDKSFGIDGSFNFNSTGYDSFPRGRGKAIVLQDDGKIILVGNTGLARLTINGALDESFISDFGISGFIASDVVINASGKILVSGSKDGAFCLAQYKSDGSLDPSFNSGSGFVTTRFYLNGGHSSALSLQDGDGKILVAGCQDVSFSPDKKFVIVRYNPDGSLDQTFSGDGLAQIGSGGSYAHASSLAIQSDGKILIAGTTNPGSKYAVTIYRLNIDGTLDQSFSGDGAVTTLAGGGYENFAEPFAIALQADGKILVAGRASADYSGSGYDVLLMRYNSDGTLDSSFGPSYSPGIVRSDISPFSFNDDVAYSIAVDLDGKITVSGASNGDFMLARYLSNGALDPDFGGLNSLGFTAQYIEGGGPTLLAGGARVYDLNLRSVMSGSSLIIQRHDSPSSDDQFLAKPFGTLSIGYEGGLIVCDDIAIGSVIRNSAGVLELLFNSKATSALVNSTLNQIAYKNISASPPSLIKLDWFFNDGNLGSQGAG